MYKPITLKTGLKTNHESLSLERQRIFELMEVSLLKPLTVLVASTGYGKTHAVKSFLRHSHLPYVWLNLQELDNIKSHFWSSFTHAVSILDKKLSSKMSELVFPETENQYSRLSALLNQYTTNSEKLVIVMDDSYHVRTKFLSVFLEKLLELKIQGIAFIIISRSKIHLNLVQFMSKGMLSLIDSEKLQFDERETLQYLNLNDVNLSPLSGSNINAAAQGWIFAIELICTTMQKTGCNDNYAINAMKSNIFQLIEAELLKPFSNDKLIFLIKLSLLERIPQGLLRLLLKSHANVSDESYYPLQRIYDDQMVGPLPDGFIEADEAYLIDMLHEINSFLCYDIYTNTFSFHNLLREYLTKLQVRLGEDDKREVYLISANYYEENDHKIEAISCLGKIGAYDQILDIVYSMPQFINAEDAGRLIEMVDAAPAELPDNELRYILHPRLLMLMGRHDEAEAEFRSNITRFEASPRTDFDYRVLSSNYNGLGFIKLLTGLYTRDYDTIYYFESANNYYQLSSKKDLGSFSVAGVGSYATRVSAPDKGEIIRAVEEFSISIPHVVNSMNGCMYGMDDLLWTEYHFFRNDLKKSERTAWQALYKARERDQFEIENRAIFYLIRIHLAMGNYSKIQDLLGLLQTQLTYPTFINRYTLYDIVTGWFYASIHQDSKIAEWLKNDFKKDDHLSLIHGFENLIRAKYFLAGKNYLPLLAFLSSQSIDNGLGAFIYGKIEMKAMEAVCHYYLKDFDDAFEALYTAWELAEPNQLDMPFIELGQNMRTLCGTALRRNTPIPNEWLESMRKKSSTYAKKAGYVASEYRLVNWNAADKLPMLTKREISLLTDLYHGLSRSEIASNHKMSINTVKAALQLIYEKLGANNAVDAVRIATALNILE